MKVNRFYLSNRTLEDDFHEFRFLTEINRTHDVNLTVLPADLSGPRKIPFAKICKIDEDKIHANLDAISVLVIWLAKDKSRDEGAVSIPPTGHRLNELGVQVCRLNSVCLHLDNHKETTDQSRPTPLESPENGIRRGIRNVNRNKDLLRRVFRANAHQ